LVRESKQTSKYGVHDLRELITLYTNKCEQVD
jgi:hypothetical protein